MFHLFRATFNLFAMSPRAYRTSPLPFLWTSPNNSQNSFSKVLSPHFSRSALADLSFSSLKSKESIDYSFLTSSKNTCFGYGALSFKLWFVSSLWAGSYGILILMGEISKELTTGVWACLWLSCLLFCECSWVWCVFILLSLFLRSCFSLLSIIKDC